MYLLTSETSHNCSTYERQSALKSLKKYTKLDSSLNCAQHEEFLEAVSVITEKCPQQIKQIFSEADSRGKGESEKIVET